MSTSAPKPTPQVGKLVSVVPVGLKEAALDSPTFRSTTLHFADQIEHLEKWLDGYVKSATKLAAELSSLENAVSSFVSQITGPMTDSEVVIDHDYTFLAMGRCGESSREVWNGLITTSKKLESIVAEPIRSFMQGELRSFKDTRRALDQTQKHYDSLQTKYSSQSKNKEPSSLREDAFQLHEARKSYLKASMDFSVQAPQIRTAVDKLLVKVSFEQWRELKAFHTSSGATFTKGAHEMERIKGWMHEMESSERSARRELVSARKHIEESAEIAARPSRELDDYAVSTVPYLGSRAPSSLSITGGIKPEKQGWVNLRILTGKPTRTTWVRRWVFLKNGIFGCLLQGSRTGGVEESERIGVLLCSVRPAFQEDRRFCFEVKTKNNSIMLQADTQKELIEWISAFEAAKQKALENPASTDLSISGNVTTQDPAFSISQPPAPEFAADPADSLTSQTSDESNSADKNGSLPVLDRDSASFRSSTDFASHRRSTGLEGDKDHVSKISQKLDLHRKTNPASQLSALQNASGGIASLISASHNILSYASAAPLSGLGNEVMRRRTLPGLDNSDSGDSTLAPPTLANPPAPTSMSRAAVAVSNERGIGLGLADDTGGMPSGMMANLWGTSNWGFLNRLETEDQKLHDVSLSSLDSPASTPRPSSRASDSPKQSSKAASTETGGDEDTNSRKQSTPGHRHRQTISLDGGDASKIQRAVVGTLHEYPSYYPQRLRTQDAQFRLLFPNLKREEALLLVFRATWNPNDQQEFPGRAYVTTRNIYFYSQWYSLVLTTSVPLSSVIEITAAPGRDCDFLFLHMAPPPGSDAPDRITVKTFLEPLKLLQRRLNFLIRESKAVEPMTLEAVLSRLIKMESELLRSPSVDSFEDVSLQGPMNGDSAVEDGRYVERDIRAPIYTEKDLLIANSGRRKDVMKFRLPAQPVVYVPQGSLHLAAEKIFDISAKALFHILFGDRSAVWQLLLHERRAKSIKQGPWVSSTSRRLRRDFQYEIETSNVLGRSTDKLVLDYQIIDVLNDHLCYVVTDKRTPWHLPFRRSFRLVSKIVITFVSKSRSKLALYTKVEWLWNPYILNRLIDSQASNDLEQDALDLLDLVSDQVRRLGVHSRTKKAITIFGHVGQQSHISEFSSIGVNLKFEHRNSRTPRTMFRLILESFLSFLESAMSSLMIWSFALMRWAWKTTSAHKVILIFLVLSMLLNGFYSVRDTHDWWQERNAGKFMARLGIQPDSVMRKAIYLRDVDEAITNSTVWHRGSNTTDCFSTFREEAIQDPLVYPSLEIGGQKDDLARSAIRRFQKTRERLGMYRHDLIIALRVVNSIDQELVQSEWERWLGVEVRHCRQIKNLLGDENHGRGADAKTNQIARNVFGEHAEDVKTWYETYCRSCQEEQDQIDRNPLGQHVIYNDEFAI